MATPTQNTTRSGAKTPSKIASSTKSKMKSAPAKVREAATKAGSSLPKPKGGKGKALAASAGVAAAAVAAGVAYKLSGRGSAASRNGRSVYHVLPTDEGWQLKGSGAERAVSNHPTKKEALSAGRELAHSKVPSQLVVHKSDGTIQESWTYESD